jgi:hypothetical protein
MLVAIHQLHYLPWLRYFEKIARADVFIVLDDAQFTKNDWQNRNRVKTASGPQVLTVPVRHRHGQRLNEVGIAPHDAWARKHWATMAQAYAKAPWFAQYAPVIEPVYHAPWRLLDSLNRHMLHLFLAMLGITTPVVYSSTLGVAGAASARLVDLVQAVGGKAYYCGAYAAEEYLDRAQFDAAGIRIEMQQWHAPVYPQLHGAFTGDLSVADVILHGGPRALEIIQSGAA